MQEHLHCRASASLFDVSHMGQAELVGEGAAAALETLTPADVQGLKPPRQRYGLLMTEAGGIFDDFMVANLGATRLFLVVNASRKDDDFALIEFALPSGVTLRSCLTARWWRCRGRPRSRPRDARAWHRRVALHGRRRLRHRRRPRTRQPLRLLR